MFAKERSIRALVMGGSGQVGSRLIESLLKASDCEKVTILSRRPLPDIENRDSRLSVRIVELDSIEREHFDGYNVGFMLLGHGKAS